MKFDSLGMIETNGLVSALVAIDKMLSLGNVEFLKKEIITNGQVTIFMIGNSSEIKRILEAGTIAAQNVGIVISSGVLPYPNDIIKEFIESKDSKSKPKKVKKSIKKVEEKVETLFDQFDEEESFNDLVAEADDNNPDVAGEVLAIKHPTQNENIIEDKIENIIEDKIENSDETQVDIPELNEELLLDENPIIDSEDIVELNNDVVTENDSANENIEIVAESSESDDLVVEIQPDEVEENVEEKTELEGMSHLERLRAEAKSEIESEKDDEATIDSLDEPARISDEIQDTLSQADGNNEIVVNKELELENELYEMNVPALRKLARSKEDFPIKGREISKANRKLLLEYFSQKQENKKWTPLCV